MNRTEFLKKLSGAAGFMLLPIKKLTAKKKNWLLQFHVRGFQYYNGPNIVYQMKPGESLTLVREPKNPYDKHAIALYHCNQKIGFVPREDNAVLSRLLDSHAATIKAEIIQIHPGAGPFDAVYAGIYLYGETLAAA
jgi:hypothetical protein